MRTRTLNILAVLAVTAFSAIAFAAEPGRTSESSSTGFTGIAETVSKAQTTPAESDRLVGDVNHDGFVDASDMAALLAQWGRCPDLSLSAEITFSSCAGDLNRDHQVDINDLVMLITAW